MSGINKTAKEIARQLKEGGMRCNCDLDNWEPERSTGHSMVCRIHKEASAIFRENARSEALSRALEAGLSDEDKHILRGL